jgi:hypothetical protein
MFTVNYLLAENARLREENHALQDANAALSHILSCIMPELGTIRVPRQFTQPKGRIEFQIAPRNCVDVIFVEATGKISQTGDPVLDNIFSR